MKIKFIIFAAIIFNAIGCSNDDQDEVPMVSHCDSEVIIDSDLFASNSKNTATIDSLEIVDNCLRINIAQVDVMEIVGRFL